MVTTFIYPEMFRSHINGSKLKQPKNYESFDQEKYPHFDVFIKSHLGNVFDTADLKNNANIIASIPDEKIKTVTYRDLINMGVRFAHKELN